MFVNNDNIYHYLIDINEYEEDLFVQRLIDGVGANTRMPRSTAK